MFKISINKKQKNTSVYKLRQEYLLHDIANEFTIIIETYFLSQVYVDHSDYGVDYRDENRNGDGKKAAVCLVVLVVVAERGLVQEIADGTMFGAEALVDAMAMHLHCGRFIDHCQFLVISLIFKTV